MNDHNLDDLIITNPSPKNGKAKNVLTLLALLIVALIIAIVLKQIIPDKVEPKVEESALETIDSELTLQNNTEAKEPAVNHEGKLSNMIEDSTDNVAENISLDTTSAEPTIEDLPEIKPDIQKTASESNHIADNIESKMTETADTVEKKSVQITDEFAQTPEQAKEVVAVPATNVKETVENVAKVAPVAKVTEKAIEKVLPKKTVTKKVVAKKETPKKVVQKKVEKKKKAEKKNTTSLSGAYYIQVGSFSQAPSRQFLGIIKSSGFNYKIMAGRSGSSKLLIGPYVNRVSAMDALPRVKDRINKSAFVVKK